MQCRRSNRRRHPKRLAPRCCQSLRRKRLRCFQNAPAEPAAALTNRSLGGSDSNAGAHVVVGDTPLAVVDQHAPQLGKAADATDNAQCGSGRAHRPSNSSEYFDRLGLSLNRNGTTPRLDYNNCMLFVQPLAEILFGFKRPFDNRRLIFYNSPL